MQSSDVNLADVITCARYVAGKEMVDYIADYLESIRDRRVFPDVKPGYMRPLMPTSAPHSGEGWETVGEGKKRGRSERLLECVERLRVDLSPRQDRFAATGLPARSRVSIVSST